MNGGISSNFVRIPALLPPFPGSGARRRGGGAEFSLRAVRCLQNRGTTVYYKNGRAASNTAGYRERSGGDHEIGRNTADAGNFLSEAPLFYGGRAFFIGRCFHNSEAVSESVFHRRDFGKITCYFSGNGEYLLNDRRYPIRDGSMVVSHPRFRTTCRTLSGKLGLYNILFLPELIDDELKKMENSFGFFSIFPPEEPAFSDLYVTDTDRGLRGIVCALRRKFRRRLHEACRLLAAAPALPVVEVALKSGFNDLSHFCYLFPREFGTLRRVR